MCAAGTAREGGGTVAGHAVLGWRLVPWALLRAGDAGGSGRLWDGSLAPVPRRHNEDSVASLSSLGSVSSEPL